MPRERAGHEGPRAGLLFLYNYQIIQMIYEFT